MCGLGGEIKSVQCRSGARKSVYDGAGAKGDCHVHQSTRCRRNSTRGRERAARALGAVSGRRRSSWSCWAHRHCLPPLATLAATIIIGWLFLVSGVVGLFTTFMMRQAPGFWWSLVSAALGIVVGLMLLARPTQRGVLAHHRAGRLLHDRRRRLDHVRARSQARVIRPMGLDAGERHRRPGAGRVVFAGLPSTAAWAIGLMVGINMVFGGSALIAMALHARNAASA